MSFNYKKVIPNRYRYLLKVLDLSSQEDLIWLGWDNLTLYKEYWEKELEEERKELKKRQEVGLSTKVEEEWIDEFVEIVDILTSSIKEAVNKPLFPCERENDHFARDEGFFIFLDGEFRNAEAVAPPIPSRKRPMIVYVAECRKAILCNIKDPTLMKYTEWKYLKTHPDYTEVWLKSAGYDGTETEKAMTEAFRSWYSW
ncbi:hypothetical protein IKF33_00125 [Candidatus Saccharibacteria bacterium]|nr:hypothetical protein [Candidatus Saccharibacteria bacterium]